MNVAPVSSTSIRLSRSISDRSIKAISYGSRAGRNSRIFFLLVVARRILEGSHHSCRTDTRARLFATGEPQQQGSSDKDRAVGTYDDSDEHRERESVTPSTAEEIQQQNGDDGCRRSQQGSAKCLIHADVDHIRSQSRTLPFHFRIRSKTTIVSFSE